MEDGRLIGGLLMEVQLYELRFLKLYAVLKYCLVANIARAGSTVSSFSDTCNPKVLNNSTSCNQMSPSPKYTVVFTRSIFKKMNVIRIINVKVFIQIMKSPGGVRLPIMAYTGRTSSSISEYFPLSYS